MAVKGLKASPVAEAADLGVNTLSKFLRGDTKNMRWDTLEAVCKVIGISNPAVLDADNPFSDTKNKLYALIEEMSDEQAEEELARLIQSRKN